MNQEKILEILYPYIPAKVLGDYLGLTVSQIYNRTFSMGIKKDPKVKKAINRALIINAGKNTRFKKGSKSWNEGKKCPNLLLTNAAKTMFKPGRKPPNTREPNATSIRYDKTGRPYSYTKVKDSKWVLTHRLIWESTYGPIPKAHVVRFKDGNNLNLNIENLECIPMRENAIRNSMQRFPSELQSVIRLKSKLNKQLKQKQNGKKRNE